MTEIVSNGGSVVSSDAITINNIELPIIEHQGQRVITLSMVDAAHGRPKDTAGRNFREHRNRLVEGEDFFEVTADEIRRQSLRYVFPPRTPKGILLAESGYLMLVKSFTDDLAWQVQRDLVKSYFRTKAVDAATNHPADMTRLEILQLALDSEQGRIAAESERDEAVRTKAQIGSRREATAMATAAAKSREVERLNHELGHNTRHATVIAIEKAMRQKFAKNVYVALRRWCRENGVTAEEVPDKRHGSVKAWPAGAWAAVHGIDLAKLFGRSR